MFEATSIGCERDTQRRRCRGSRATLGGAALTRFSSVGFHREYDNALGMSHFEDAQDCRPSAKHDSPSVVSRVVSQLSLGPRQCVRWREAHVLPRREVIMVRGSLWHPACLVLSLLIGSATPLHASAGVQQPAERSDVVIEACQLDLTDLGKRASFQGTLVYQLSTGETGRIVSVEKLKGHLDLDPFLRLDQLDCCVRRWRLKRSTVYALTLTVGTTGETLEHWWFGLCEHNGECVRLVLPRLAKGCSDAT